MNKITPVTTCTMLFVMFVLPRDRARGESTETSANEPSTNVHCKNGGGGEAPTPDLLILFTELFVLSGFPAESAALVYDLGVQYCRFGELEEGTTVVCTRIQHRAIQRGNCERCDWPKRERVRERERERENLCAGVTKGLLAVFCAQDPQKLIVPRRTTTLIPLIPDVRDEATRSCTNEHQQPSARETGVKISSAGLILASSFFRQGISMFLAIYPSAVRDENMESLCFPRQYAERERERERHGARSSGSRGSPGVHVHLGSLGVGSGQVGGRFISPRFSREEIVYARHSICVLGWMHRRHQPRTGRGGISSELIRPSNAVTGTPLPRAQPAMPCKTLRQAQATMCFVWFASNSSTAFRQPLRFSQHWMDLGRSSFASVSQAHSSA